MSEPAESKRSLLNSAEAVVVIVLLAVFAAVGITYWLLTTKEVPAVPRATTPAAAQVASAQSGAGERAALGAVEQKLQGDFAQLDQQRQLQERRTQLEREASAAATTENTKQRVESIPAGATPALPAPQTVVPEPPISTQVPRLNTPPTQVIRASPVHVPVRSEATVDWTSCQRPEYPQSSLERAEEGVVVLSFKLDVRGAVLGGNVLTTSGSARLDDAALRALAKCRFKPATADGVPITSVAQVRFRWRLGK